MSDNVIEVQNLVKYFDGRCVLEDINFSVPRGSIYGLLGRNGAGKTTTIRILLGLEPPTRGRTSLLEVESTNLSPKVRGRIGCVAEGHNLIQNYKVSRLVKLCKDLSLQWDDKTFDH
ncbi:MAG: ATP-binding cassette domain-containing protein, partial [Planctomycetota bacterium]